MAFFPRSFISSDSSTSFHPLFRLLDDFDTYSRSSGPAGHQKRVSRHQKVFAPKFDVREVENAYELHGELPGIDQKDVNIEFTDEHTLVIRGRSERSYTAGAPPQSITEGDAQEQKQIEAHNEHQSTVEDDPEEPATPDTVASQLAKQEEHKKPEEQQQPHAKYWISERSVGEFARNFSFPGRVEHDAVTASMKNGILSITVPKAKKLEARKITIV